MDVCVFSRTTPPCVCTRVYESIPAECVRTSFPWDHSPCCVALSSLPYSAQIQDPRVSAHGSEPAERISSPVIRG